MKLIQLKYFYEVALEKNFTKAAEKLYVTQSTLSKSIHALEEELGTTLINRQPGGLTLTDDGKIVYEYASRILSYADAQAAALKKELSREKKLTLGIPPTAGAIYFSSIIHQCRTRCPQISIDVQEINSREIINRLLKGSLDLGAVIEPFDDERFIKKDVCKSEAVLVVSRQHRLSRKKTATLSEIRDDKILMVNSTFMYRDLVEEKCKEAGFQPIFAFESPQWEFIFEMVADNAGVSILPKPLVDKFNNGKVHMLHLEHPSFPWSLAVIRRADRKCSREMQTFLDLCS